MYVSIGAPSVVDKNTGVIIRGEGQLVDTDLVVPLTKVNTLDIGVYSATSDQIDTVNGIVLFSIEKVTLPWMENIILINVQ